MRTTLTKYQENRNQAGFTLVEVVIVMFILGLILTAMLTLFEWHGKIYSFQQATFRVSNSSRAGMQSINNYTRQARRVLASQAVNGTTYTSTSTSLVLQLPAYDSSGNTLSNKWDYVAYYVDGANLYQVVAVDPLSKRMPGTKQLTDTLHSITFTFDNVDFDQIKKVSVDLQARDQFRGQYVNARLQQNIMLKNY